MGEAPGAPGDQIFAERGPVPIRRALGWALVGALCVAAFTASVALLTGSFDDTDWRVVGTSVGFAIFSSTAASGATLRAAAPGEADAVGLIAIVASACAFVLLLAVVWVDDGSEGLWRSWGVAAILALGASHASLVLRARRPTDTQAVVQLTSISVALGTVDSLLGILPIAGAFEIDEQFGQIIGVLVIALLLTTALPPILRRLARQGGAAAVAAAPPAPPPPTSRLAGEVLAAADRLDAASAEPRVRAEAERLRELARLAGA
jgi:hypothetical protein